MMSGKHRRIAEMLHTASWRDAFNRKEQRKQKSMEEASSEMTAKEELRILEKTATLKYIVLLESGCEEDFIEILNNIIRCRLMTLKKSNKRLYQELLEEARKKYKFFEKNRMCTGDE